MLFRLFECLGTPTEENYYGLSKLADFKTTFPKFPGKGLQSLFIDNANPIDSVALDLLK